MNNLETILTRWTHLNASDAFIEQGDAVRFKVHGETTVQEDLAAIQSEQDIIAFLKEHIPGIDIEGVLQNKKEVDWSLTLGDGTFVRANVYRTSQGVAATLRYLPNSIPELEQLWLPEKVLEFPNLKEWLVLVTGTTGSGKSTTLASIIHRINQTRRSNIITLEDPIEYKHSNIHSKVQQREVWRDTESFRSGLRAALRQAPDVLLVGELRDYETTSLALTAAQTGILVLGTLHTNGAASTATRILDIFPPDSHNQIKTMLAETLRWVLWQALEKSVQGWRVPICELLLPHAAIRNGDLAAIQRAINAGKKDGMISKAHFAQELSRDGIISDEVLAKYPLM